MLRLLSTVSIEVLLSTISIEAKNTYHRGSITVLLSSCLTGLDSTKQVKLMLIQYKQSS